MIKKLSDKQFKFVILLLCFVICTLYFICKRSFVMDESFSFTLSNCFTGEYSGWITYSNNNWIGKELLNKYAITEYAFNYKGVWNNMYWDVHPPLYHYILHTISSIFKGRFSLWFSYIINAPCFLINCLLVLNIVNSITNNRIIVALSVITYTLNDVFLFNFGLIRMYQLASTLALLTIYIALNYVGKEKENILVYLLITALVILGGLTHYYYYFAVVCFFIVYGIYLLINKRVMAVIKLAACSVLALVLNIFVFFTATFHHFTYSHGKNALDTIKNLAFDFSKYKAFIVQTWGGEVVFIFGIILFAICLYKSIKHEKKYNLPLILLSSYYFYFIIIANISDMTSIRYMMPMESVSYLGIMIALITIVRDKRVLILVMIGIMILGTNLSWLKSINKESSWEYAENHQDDLALVYVSPGENYNNINASLFADLRWYLNTYVCDNIETLVNEDFGEEFILYIEKSKSTSEIDEILRNIVNGNTYEYKKEDIVTSNFDVYKFTRQ